MDKRLHDKLIADIADLRNLVSGFSTEIVVGMVAINFMRWPEKDIGLSSPYRQLFFLLGLMLSTPEPTDPHEFDDEAWNKSVNLLERIFFAYAWMFWPTAEEAGRLTQDWKDAREIAMPAFLNYFNSGLLASTEQIRDRIKRYIVPHDSAVRGIFSISATDMLEITEVISQQMQADYDSLASLKEKEEQARLSFLDEAERKKWDFETMQHEAAKSSYSEVVRTFLSALRRISTVSRSFLQSKFGAEKADTFLQVFSAARGSVEKLTYPTELNPAMESPLYVLSDDILMVPSAHTIYLAILEKSERSLLQSGIRDKFLRQRDQVLENQAVEILRGFFGEKATVWHSVFDTDKQQYEHDILILWERRLFTVEAKAAPPREPLRDPDKAYIRIRDDFRSDRGIQKAYDQARRIEDIYDRGETIHLYDKHGKLICEVSPEDINRIYSICVTRDNYGMLATDLSLLLEKEPRAPYPLAINILDLDSLLDAFSYFSWGPEKLCEYIDGREKMHGRVMASDELEYAGFLIDHGTFDYLLKGENDRYQLTPRNAKVFDQIFHAKHGGEAVKYDPKPPVTTNFSFEMKKWMAERMPDTMTKNTPKRAVRKQGRNEPCACGSGKKFKRCCGR